VSLEILDQRFSAVKKDISIRLHLEKISISAVGL
jgi:hypothetical protein